jgi:hypothetical protein
VTAMRHLALAAAITVSVGGCVTPEQVAQMSDRQVCHGAVTWSDLDQIPRWSSFSGAYRHTAQSRGLSPHDCHDTTFECLDYGFAPGSDDFKQCRMQLVLDRRQWARDRAVYELAAFAAMNEQIRREEYRLRRAERRWSRRKAQKAERQSKAAPSKHVSSRVHRVVPKGPATTVVEKWQQKPVHRKAKRIAREKRHTSAPRASAPSTASQTPIMRAAREALRKSRARTH